MTALVGRRQHVRHSGGREGNEGAAVAARISVIGAVIRCLSRFEVIVASALGSRLAFPRVDAR